MSKHMALLVADEIRKAHPHLDTRIVEYPDGTCAVKASDRGELVFKFDGSKAQK